MRFACAVYPCLHPSSAEPTDYNCAATCKWRNCKEAISTQAQIQERVNLHTAAYVLAAVYHVRVRYGVVCSDLVLSHRLLVEH